MTGALVLVSWIGSIALVLIGGLIAAGALYLVVLAVAACAYKPTRSAGVLNSRLVVLVPAHNEADFIERCLASLRRQSYPQELFDIVVIADNCTDSTAEIAARSATVLSRNLPDKRGKGHALRWAMDQIMSDSDRMRPDAIVVVDADSEADPGLLEGLVACLEDGADAVQAEYLVMEGAPSPQSQLRELAFLLFHRVRFSGRAAIGLPCTLVGNGMLFSLPLLERYPWNAFTGAEDLEYSLNLRLMGIRPKYAGSALVYGPMPDSARAAQVQRERWEGGRYDMVRRYLPRMMREILTKGRLSIADAAVDLALPPLGLLLAAAIAGTVVASALSLAGILPGWTVVPWAASDLGVLAFVVVGMRAARAPGHMYLSLISAPAFVARKLIGTIGVVRRSSSTSWVRTERPSDVVR